jgi:hypothetical protein
MFGEGMNLQRMEMEYVFSIAGLKLCSSMYYRLPLVRLLEKVRRSFGSPVMRTATALPTTRPGEHGEYDSQQTTDKDLVFQD